MKRLLLFAVAAAAVSASCATINKEPTFHQVERLIKAASGDTTPVPDSPKMYAKPTFAQVERLIQAVNAGSSVDLSDYTTFAQSTNVVTSILGRVHINGQTLSEDVSVTTFAPFKSSWRNRYGTMQQLCEDISNDPDAKRGMCFLGEIQSKTPMPDVHLGNCEVIVKICKNGVLNFEAFSTDTGSKHWDGVAHGSSFMGWRQVVTVPEVTANGSYTVKMNVTSSGQSKTYEWVPYTTGSDDAIKGVVLNGNELDVDEDTKKAVGTILSCSPFPEGTDVGKKLNPWVTIPVSTLKFCKSLATNKNVVAGMTYYGSVSLSEEIQDVVPGLSEVTVHCLRADRTDPDPDDNTSTNGCVILMLERTSTNTGMRHWMCAYEYFGYNNPSYPWSNHNVYPDGKPSYGTTNMPWYGILFKPVPGHNNGPVPLERKYTAASLQELDDTATSVVQEGSNTVIAMTGIHQGERTMNPQYDRGNWMEPAVSLTNCTVEIGVNAHATETSGSSQAVAIGRDSLSVGSATVAVGPNAFAEKNQAIALGWRANAVGSHAISIGTAKKSGEDYYSNGVVNVYSDLNLAEGDYSIAMGYNAKAVGTDSIALGDMAKAGAAGAVQIGFGTNNVAHTLKFENVTIVKNGQVVGATPEPESKDPSIGTTTDDMTLTVKPGSMTTVLPATKLDPGSELAIHCTGMRNYTVYLPNEENVRQGLPVNVMFEIQRGTAQAVIGTNVFTRLPIRLKAEQPYNGLAVVDTTNIDDGYDWTPSVTNCLLVYNGTASKFYCPSGTQKSLEGVSLQAGKVYKLAYPTSVSGGSATNTVDLMTMPTDKPFMDATFYGEVGAVEYSATAVTPYTYTDGDDDYVDVKITYETVNGACTFDTRVKVEGIE